MKHIKFVIAAVVVVGLILFFARKLEKSAPETKDADDITKRPELAYIAVDRKTLENKASNVWEVSAAMVRLGKLGEKRAFDEAKKSIESENEILRAGAAEALGYDKDPASFELVIKATKDKSEEVRKHALMGLGHRKSSDNEKTLKDLISSGKLTDNEAVSAFASIIQISDSLDERLKMIANLLKIAKSAKDPAKSEAIHEAATYGPREPSVVEYLTAFISNSDDGDMTAYAIRHLAAVDPARLIGRLPSLLKHSNREVRVAVVQTLALTCPADRWDILKQVLATDKEPIVFSEGVQSIVQMGGQEALSFAVQLKNNKNLSQEQALAVDSAMKKMTDHNGPDACASRQTTPRLETKVTKSRPKPLDKPVSNGPGEEPAPSQSE